MKIKSRIMIFLLGLLFLTGCFGAEAETEEDKETVQSLLRKANIALENGKYEEAKNSFKAVLEQDETNQQANMSMGLMEISSMIEYIDNSDLYKDAINTQEIVSNDITKSVLIEDLLGDNIHAGENTIGEEKSLREIINDFGLSSLIKENDEGNVVLYGNDLTSVIDEHLPTVFPFEIDQEDLDLYKGKTINFLNPTTIQDSLMPYIERAALYFSNIDLLNMDDSFQIPSSISGLEENEDLSRFEIARVGLILDLINISVNQFQAYDRNGNLKESGAAHLNNAYQAYLSLFDKLDVFLEDDNQLELGVNYSNIKRSFKGESISFTFQEVQLVVNFKNFYPSPPQTFVPLIPKEFNEELSSDLTGLDWTFGGLFPEMTSREKWNEIGVFW